MSEFKECVSKMNKNMEEVAATRGRERQGDLYHLVRKEIIWLEEYEKKKIEFRMNRERKERLARVEGKLRAEKMKMNEEVQKVTLERERERRGDLYRLVRKEIVWCREHEKKKTEFRMNRERKECLVRVQEKLRAEKMKNERLENEIKQQAVLMQQYKEKAERLEKEMIRMKKDAEKAERLEKEMIRMKKDAEKDEKKVKEEEKEEEMRNAQEYNKITPERKAALLKKARKLKQKIMAEKKEEDSKKQQEQQQHAAHNEESNIAAGYRMLHSVFKLW